MKRERERERDRRERDRWGTQTSGMRIPRPTALALEPGKFLALSYIFLYVYCRSFLFYQHFNIFLLFKFPDFVIANIL